MTATLPPSIKFQPLVAGAPIPDGKVYFYAAGTLTPQTAYAADGTTPIVNPLVLDANGAASFRLDPALSYKIDLTDSVGTPVVNWPVDQVTSADAYALSLNMAMRADFANTATLAKGDALLGVLQPFTGAVVRTQHQKNIEHISLADFPNLATAVSGIGSTPAILHLNASSAVAANLTIPATLQIDVEPGTTLTIATGQTLTINGPFRAKPLAIFAGLGSVVFGPGAADGVYPHWWGVPATEASAPIQKAANSLSAVGGDVLFPSGAYNLYTGLINIPSFVNLRGLGGKIYRKFPYVSTDATTVRTWVLNGDNVISGLIYDGGGWDAAVYPGTGNGATPFVYYQEFTFASGTENYKIIGNTFLNAPGAFFTPFGSKIEFVGNIFQDWRDHCIYLSEGGATARMGYVVNGNIFKTVQATGPTTREPIKFKGRVGGIIISGNTFTLPNVFTVITASIDYDATMEFGDITISGNAATWTGSGSFVRLEQYDNGAGSLDTSLMDTVNIIGNTLNGSYVLLAGGFPTSQTVQQGIRIKRLVIANNICNGGIININGRDGVGHNGIEVCRITGNTINSFGSISALMGNIKALIVDGNYITSPTAFWCAFKLGDSTSFLTYWKAGTVNTAFKGTAIFTNNVLDGTIQWLLLDFGANGTLGTSIGLDVFVDGNRFLSATTPATARFVQTVVAYPPATQLTVGPFNYVAPGSMGAIDPTPFVWPAAQVKYSGVSMIGGYRTHAGVPNETPYFIGEELLDTTNSKWYKAKALTSADWVALN